jgi:aryl-alcohol dehydrogenase-like predicted oxidoreductase
MLIVTVRHQIFWGGDGVNEKGLSRKHVREGIDESLKNLQLEYVDLVFCQRPAPLTPPERVVRAMTDMGRCGRPTAWGTSEWSAQQITEAFWMARQFGKQVSAASAESIFINLTCRSRTPYV